MTAPTLYHHFGDADGWSAPRSTAASRNFLPGRSRGPPPPHPEADLAEGWDDYVAFARERPRLYAAMIARVFRRRGRASGGGRPRPSCPRETRRARRGRRSCASRSGCSRSPVGDGSFRGNALCLALLRHPRRLRHRRAKGERRRAFSSTPLKGSRPWLCSSPAGKRLSGQQDCAEPDRGRRSGLRAVALGSRRRGAGGARGRARARRPRTARRLRLPPIRAVVHAAAHFRLAGPRAPFFRTNVEGTRALIAAARAAKAAPSGSSSSVRRASSWTITARS